MATYEGTVNQNKKLHGKGKVTFSDNTVFEGYFKEGKIFGPGKLTLPDNVKYEGEVNSSGEAQGKGKIIKNNGEETYTGMFENSIYTGVGRLEKKYGTTTKTVETNFSSGDVDLNESMYCQHMNDQEDFYYRGNGEVGVFESTVGFNYTFYFEPESRKFMFDNQKVEINGTGVFEFYKYIYKGTVQQNMTVGEGMFISKNWNLGFGKNHKYYSKTFGKFNIKELNEGSFSNNSNYFMTEVKATNTNTDLEYFEKKMDTIKSNAEKANNNIKSMRSHLNTVLQSINSLKTTPVECKDCFSYKGEFDKVTGLINGDGELTTPLGTYQGNFDNNGDLHSAKFTHKNGEYWSEGKINKNNYKSEGESKRVYKTGKTQIGTFQNDYLMIGTDITKVNGKNEGRKLYENGNTYVGEFNDDRLPHGRGSLTLRNHKMFEKYAGKFENDQIIGQIEAYPKNKNDFVGKYVGFIVKGELKNGKIEAYPRNKKDNVEKYIFNFENNERSLESVNVFYNNGRSFLGSLTQDGFQKSGTLSFESSDTLGRVSIRGEVNSQGEGKGILTFKNGDIYEGEYPKGKGTLTFTNGDVYIGDYPKGKGVLTFKNGDASKYIGEFPTGKGTLKFKNGDIYEGDYPPKGKGTLKFTNGDIYEGDYPEGKGTLTFTNHEIYHSFQGSFKNGVPIDKIGTLKFKGTQTYYTGKYRKDPLELTSGKTTFQSGLTVDISPVKRENGKLIVLIENSLSNMTDIDRQNKITLISDNVEKEKQKLKKVEIIPNEVTLKIAKAENIIEKHIDTTTPPTVTYNNERIFANTYEDVFQTVQDKKQLAVKDKIVLTDKVLDKVDKVKTEVGNLVEKTTKLNSLLQDIQAGLGLDILKGKDVKYLIDENDKIKKEEKVDNALRLATELKNKLNKAIETVNNTTNFINQAKTEINLIKNLNIDVSSHETEISDVENDTNIDKAFRRAKLLKESLPFRLNNIKEKNKLLDEAKSSLRSIKELAKDRDVKKIEDGITDAENEIDITKAIAKAGDVKKQAETVLKEITDSVEKAQKLKKLAWGVAGVAGVAGVSYYLYNKFKKSKKESTRKRSSERSAARSSKKKGYRSSGRGSHRSSARKSNRKSARSSSRSYSS